MIQTAAKHTAAAEKAFVRLQRLRQISVVKGCFDKKFPAFRDRAEVNSLKI